MLEIIAEKYGLKRSEVAGKLVRAGAIQILESIDIDIDWKEIIINEGYISSEELEIEIENLKNKNK